MDDSSNFRGGFVIGRILFNMCHLERRRCFGILSTLLRVQCKAFQSFPAIISRNK
jgi:hypothetical protein